MKPNGIDLWKVFYFSYTLNNTDKTLIIQGDFKMKINSPLLYYHLFVLLLLSTSLIKLSTAWANCEAGGYSIHTIAEYRSSNKLGTFYRFYKQEGKNYINIFNTVVGNSQGVSPPNFKQDVIRGLLFPHKPLRQWVLSFPSPQILTRQRTQTCRGCSRCRK